MMMPETYDINEIFAEMEQDLLASYRRNMARHAQEEIDLGFSWEMWQARKLRDLAVYRKESRIIVDKHSKRAKSAATGIIIDNYNTGSNTVDALLKGIRRKVDVPEGFGKINRRKLDAILDAVNNDLDKAGQATLRLVDDEYRKIVYKSQVMYNAGATTLPKAIDSAAKDFLMAGINCITYKNGARVNIASYSEMAVRTSSKKAYLTGEGAKMAEWGESLSQITSYGGCSPLCLPWQGKVYVNDVYAGGKPDGKHTLLSTAMANGLFHPNCRHTAQPYFEGISYPPPEQDVQTINNTYAAEQKQRGIERKIRQWKRVSAGSVDEANKTAADNKVRTWQAQMREHLHDNPFLSRRSYREQVIKAKA